jgi:hypothetical protein
VGAVKKGEESKEAIVIVAPHRARASTLDLPTSAQSARRLGRELFPARVNLGSIFSRLARVS